MPSTRETARTLRLQGLSYTQIGQEMGLSRQRVQQLCTVGTYKLLADPATIDKFIGTAHGMSITPGELLRELLEAME